MCMEYEVDGNVSFNTQTILPNLSDLESFILKLDFEKDNLFLLKDYTWIINALGHLNYIGPMRGVFWFWVVAWGGGV